MTNLQALHPQIKILFVIGLGGAELLEFFGISPDDQQFLKKPFTASKLREPVIKMLGDNARSITHSAGSVQVGAVQRVSALELIDVH